MKLSVIIPTYNEENQVQSTIEAVQRRSGDLLEEIIVVDGGSTDATVEKARLARARVFESPMKGRAAQMNYGAEQANADILYFLHADSRPPANFAGSVKQAVAKGADAGCFRLAFDDNHFLLNAYAWFTRFDVDAFRYGDQSLFIKRKVFKNIGGFLEDHIVMEDNEIVRRIKKDYSFTILEDAVETSARTYREVGVIKLQLIFTLIYILYFAGIEQESLADIKRNV
jgi:rSAM/selenodomain-associated transferase 2